jgi:hypothetical protein
MMVGINLEYFTPFQTRDPKLQELVFLLVGFLYWRVNCSSDFDEFCGKSISEK